MAMSGWTGEAARPVDPTALVERLYEEHHAQVLRLALRYGGGRRAWAEDVVQDVFVSLLGALQGLRDVDDLGAWFYKVTTHRCLTRLRREQWRALITLQHFREPQQAPDLDARIEARSELARALSALETLPPKERVAFAMYHLDGKELLEIGALLGHSKGYVSKLIQRAEAKIGGPR